MLLTGLFLWWPRKENRSGLGGVLWPRLGQGRQRFWRDLHAVTGLWVALRAMFLIASGLPWAKNWGGYLKQVGVVTGTAAVRQDWSGGSEADAHARMELDKGARAMMDEHAGHHGMAMPHVKPTGDALDRVIPEATRLGLAGPAEVSPPTQPGGRWLAQSEAANRMRRVSAEFGADGEIVGVQTFDQRHWIDRLVGIGIAVHEGAWLGLLNQLLNLAVLPGVVTLALSSTVLWWRRRPKGLLGAPTAKGTLRHSWPLVVATLLLAVLMPLFGMTLAMVVLFERIARRTPEAVYGLGLRTVGT